VGGICGGYQLLGQVIRDPQQVESSEKQIPGLNLLPVETIFSHEKATFQAEARVTIDSGWLAGLYGQTVSGYEIHQGRTTGGENWLEIISRNSSTVRVGDGAQSRGGRVWGCYLHGLFSNANLRRNWLASLGWMGEQAETQSPFTASLERLADTLENHLDMPELESMIWEN
jgi:adenosylcobyric acid synthase